MLEHCLLLGPGERALQEHIKNLCEALETLEQHWQLLYTHRETPWQQGTKEPICIETKELHTNTALKL